MKRIILGITFLSVFIFLACHAGNRENHQVESSLKVGAERSGIYLPLLQGKKVGVVVNNTSMVGEQHLVDFLKEHQIDVATIFAPEHGFRGKTDAGEQFANTVDQQTGIPIISLYGSTKKPTPEMIDSLDVLVFDIQDVGARFYTYISTMQYVMEACAENNKKMIVLDRPNPNGFYVDGPVLNPQFKSFVGLNPIPVVYGMTLGELAKMINGEGWLANGVQCDLQVVPVEHYDHNVHYSLPIPPSPNLPNDQSVNLYPSLCLFEGTAMSVGRGTYFPFQVIGYPDSVFGDFTFTPQPIAGMDKDPKLKGQKCFGVDLRNAPELNHFSLEVLINFYKKWHNEGDFFTSYFNTLAGNDQLKQQIISGMSEAAIRATWQEDLGIFKQKRKKYLLYPDFE